MKKVLFSICYWVLSLTWGSILTLIGFIGFLIALCITRKCYKNGCTLYIKIGGNWGGLSLGPFAFVGNTNISWMEHCRRHEFGHSLQNILFGPIQIIWSICSAFRYWYQIYMREYKGLVLGNNWYESFWVEHTATSWGTKFINWLEN